MIIVTFEITVKKGQTESYLAEAKKLLPLVSEIEGFICVERFCSINNPNKVISVSKWENMQAVKLWKQNMHHIHAQNLGRDSIFLDYNIHVSEVCYHYDLESSTFYH